MTNEPMTSSDLHGQRVVNRLRSRQGSVIAVTAVAAAVSVMARTILTIAGNLPFEPVAGTSLFVSLFSVTTPLTLAATASAVAVTVEIPPVRVGLLFVAAFVIVGSISPAAGLPAILGVSAGGALSLLGAVDGELNAGTYRQLPLVGAAILGMILSLWGTVGFVPGGTHTVGVGATLVAIIFLGVELPVDRLSLLVGIVAALGVLGVTILAPFATGATLLVGFAITNIPVVVVAIAVAGVGAALASGLRDRAVLPVAGCGLCLFSGIPTTPESAAGLVIGLTVVLCREALANPRGEIA